jgi:hypothetical protein
MEGMPMRLYALALGAAVIVLTTAAVASDLPKEGKISGGTYSAVGTYRPITAGKNLAASIFDETGIGTGPRPVDHVTWRCIGVFTAIDGQAQAKGNCVGTDPSGDQMFTQFAGDRYPADAKSFTGKASYLGGTGKYDGMSGGFTYTLYGPQFKVAAELSYVQYGTVEGDYKLK